VLVTRRRDARRLQVGSLAALFAAAVLAGCLPVAPPSATQYCASSTPTSAAGYQSAFDSLRQTYTGWVTADNAVPVNLPDGRVVWMFGDTYTGRANADGTIPGSDGLIHNSFVVQSGPCFAPLMGGSPATPSSSVPDPSPGQWYWPTAGVVDGGVLRVFLYHVEQGTGGAPGLNFSIVDMRLASFALPSLTLLGVQPLPFPADPTHPYGATVLSVPTTSSSPGYVYAYGATQGNPDGGNSYVARTPTGDVASGPWQFFTGTSWVADPNGAAPMWSGAPANPFFGSGAGPDAQLWVVPFDGGYLGTAEPIDAFSSTVAAWTSSSPAGPWTYFGSIASTPTSIPSYDAATRLNLPGTTAPVVEFSTNNGEFSGAAPTISGYGPHFVTPSALPGTVSEQGGH